jgi:phosphoribosylamine--glycine ligase
VFALCDGTDAVLLLPAQDHKRLGEGDTGPNTGGMGAYAPVSIASPGLLEDVKRRVVLPTLRALRDDASEFRGLLYAGLMITPEGPRVVEFNARFGDPETQVVVPLLESSLLEPLLAIARGDAIAGWLPAWRAGAAVTTVVAAAGYPGAVAKGAVISLPAPTPGDSVLLFHAATTVRDGVLHTSGGRVLAVTGLGANLAEAAERSRSAAAQVRFDGAQFRRDIAWRELVRTDSH